MTSSDAEDSTFRPVAEAQSRLTLRIPAGATTITEPKLFK